MCHMSYREDRTDGSQVQPRREEEGWRDLRKESKRRKSEATVLISSYMSIEVSGTEALNDSYTWCTHNDKTNCPGGKFMRHLKLLNNHYQNDCIAFR